MQQRASKGKGKLVGPPPAAPKRCGSADATRGAAAPRRGLGWLATPAFATVAAGVAALCIAARVTAGPTCAAAGPCVLRVVPNGGSVTDDGSREAVTPALFLANHVYGADGQPIEALPQLWIGRLLMFGAGPAVQSTVLDACHPFARPFAFDAAVEAGAARAAPGAGGPGRAGAARRQGGKAAHSQGGKAAHSQGELVGAVAAFERAGRADPGLPETWVWMARALIRTARRPSAALVKGARTLEWYIKLFLGVHFADKLA